MGHDQQRVGGVQPDTDHVEFWHSKIIVRGGPAESERLQSFVSVEDWFVLGRHGGCCCPTPQARRDSTGELILQRWDWQVPGFDGEGYVQEQSGAEDMIEGEYSIEAAASKKK